MAQDWEVKLIRDPRFRAMAPDRQKVLYQEAGKRYGGVATTEAPLTGTARVEQEISQRPSSIADFRKILSEPRLGPGELVDRTLQSPDPSREAFERMLAPFGAAREALLGVPSSAVLAIQQGRPQEIGSDIMKTLRGERPAAPGSVLRQAGVQEEDPLSKLARFSASNPDVVYGAARSIPTALNGAKQLISSGPRIAEKVGQAVKNTGNFLIGNPRGINQAERNLGKAGQELVRSIRPNGTLANTFWKGLKKNAEKAWRPMKEVIRAIKEPITIDDMNALAQTKFANDPVKMNNIQELINIASSQPKPPRLFDFKGNVIEFPKGTWTADELDELASGFGEGMRKTVKAGSQARDSADQLLAETRSFIADLIESKAPADMKGMVRTAKSQWSSHKADVDTAFRLFRPSAPKEAFTKSGVSAMKKVATGQPGVEDEADFFNRFKQNYGIDVPGAMQPSAQALKRQENIGLGGKTVTGVGALGGIGAILRLLGLAGKAD